MATIEKRKNKFLARVRLKNQNFSKTFDTRSEAKMWATQTEADILNRSLGVVPKNMTVSDLIYKYISEITPTKRGAHKEATRLKAIIKSDFTRTLLTDLKPLHIARWRDQRLKTIQGSTFNRELSVLSSVFNYAVKEWGVLHENPISKVKRPSNNKARDRRPDDDEIRRICYWCKYDETVIPTLKKQRTALAFLFAIETAMRAGEICGLKWEDIYFDRRIAHLEMTKNGHSRDVPLSKRAITLLRQLQKAELKTVFDLNADVMGAFFRRACRDCEIVDLHFHDSRREALTRMAKKVDVMDLAKISGHRDIKILLNTYYNPNIENLADLLD